MTVFTDRRNGIFREDEPITRSVGREEVVLDVAIKKEIYRSLDQFFDSDRSFYVTYDIPYKRGFCSTGIRATARRRSSNPSPEVCPDR